MCLRDDRSGFFDGYVTMSIAVVVSNDTGMVCEIRIDSPDGPKLAALAPYERQRTIWLEFSPYAYQFFPIYIYYDGDTKGVRAIMPQSLGGSLMMPEPLMPGRRVPMMTFDSSFYNGETISLLFE